MTDDFKLDRHDTDASHALGHVIALEVAIAALLKAHPDRRALAAAWKDAEDMGFTWTADPDPRVGAARTEWVREAYLLKVSSLRELALGP